MLWNLPEEWEVIQKTVFKLVVSGGTNTEKLRLDAEDLKTTLSIALKNELPIRVVCDSCGEEVQLRENLELHHTACPNHSYTLRQERNSRIYPYDNLVKEIDYLHASSGKKNTLSQVQREVFEKGFESLASRVNRVKQRLEDEKDLLRDLMDANIWLSTADRNEALLLYDTENTQLSYTEALIDEIRNILGLQNKEDRPIESRSLKNSSFDLHIDPHATKLEARSQVPGSGSSSNAAVGFIKGLRSRFKLR
ncbi:hypothetical protein [Methanosarcina barkeri]|uniref:Uncharacterized protein n=1 Tax=Methanosarcina barkeri CM1 TaxID=796385 RepID=A0A0G3C6X4_METBA|nr:hypothetical protein [Methanosarcina barkeri]AKJ37734.1 hypothetical protein MCM1_0644 [Methanosarcina barkeri CM1]